MSNEIKQGDKVMVSKDAPEEFERFKGDDMNYEVVRINSSKVIIQHKLAAGLYGFTLSVPAKYLVKVDAEAKEAKFKVGEEMFWLPGKTIRHKCTITEVIKNEHSGKWEYNVLFEWGKPGKWIPESELALYTEPTAPKFKVGDRVRCKNPLRLANSTDNDFIGIVTDAVTYGENGWFNVRMNNGATFQTYHESDLELIEPAKQTHQRATIISEGDIHSLDETPTNNVGSITIPVEVDLTDSYWEAYTADLAREVALKVANKFNTPKEVAEYAVKVAKAVVDGLKRM